MTAGQQHAVDYLAGRYGEAMPMRAPGGRDQVDDVLRIRAFHEPGGAPAATWFVDELGHLVYAWDPDRVFNGYLPLDPVDAIQPAVTA